MAFKDYLKYVVVLNTKTNTIAEGALAWVKCEIIYFKDQLISKGNFSVFNSPKKRT